MRDPLLVGMAALGLVGWIVGAYIVFGPRKRVGYVNTLRRKRS